MDWVENSYAVVDWDLFFGMVYQSVDNDELYYGVSYVGYM